MIIIMYKMVRVAGSAPAISCPPDRRDNYLRHTLMKWSGWWAPPPRSLVPETSAILDFATA